MRSKLLVQRIPDILADCAVLHHIKADMTTGENLIKEAYAAPKRAPRPGIKTE
jgi:hypothetical protein